MNFNVQKLTVRDWIVTLKNAHVLMARAPGAFSIIFLILISLLIATTYSQAAAALLIACLWPFGFVVAEVAFHADHCTRFQLSAVFTSAFPAAKRIVMVYAALFITITVGFLFNAEWIATHLGGNAQLSLLGIDPKKLEPLLITGSHTTYVVIVLFATIPAIFAEVVIRYLLCVKNGLTSEENSYAMGSSFHVNFLFRMLHAFAYLQIGILLGKFVSPLISIYCLVLFPVHEYLIYKATFGGTSELEEERIKSENLPAQV